MGKDGDKPFNAPFAELGKALSRVAVAPATREREKHDRAAKQRELRERRHHEGATRRERAGDERELEGELSSVRAVGEATNEDPAALFAAATAGARPLGKRGDYVQTRPQRSGSGPPTADAEVIAELDALVAGHGTFEVICTDEHVEGLAHGVDRKLLRRLRRGDYSFRRHLDLHGLTRKEAKPEVATFLTSSRLDGERCVLIVHGRGLNSKDRVPVLKEALSGWLTRGEIGRIVLAFCSARPVDGGLGAVYVLLRR